MNTLSKLMLESGLIDEAMAKMFQRYGIIDETASEATKRSSMESATRDELVRFADRVEEEVEKRRKIRESMLDLNQIRWPVMVSIYDGDKYLAQITGVIDRLGRYYFRAQDVKRAWFSPGFTFFRVEHSGDIGREAILEVTELSIGEEVAAIQVSTKKE